MIKSKEKIDQRLINTYRVRKARHYGTSIGFDGFTHQNKNGHDDVSLTESHHMKYIEPFAIQDDNSLQTKRLYMSDAQRIQEKESF